MNVWILFMSEEGDLVIGPFTSVTIEADLVSHTLTNRPILRRNHESRVWMIESSSRFAIRFVVQQGGFTSPWGERGRHFKVDA